jgi:CDP-glucose 4,6-dehydratase
VSVRSPLATRPWQHVLEPLSGYLWLGARLLARQPQINGEAFNFGPDSAVNQTVGELLDAMMQRWPGATWQATGNAGGGHEAQLLKLSCDKALFHLNWRAVLHFAETVAFTVDWYRNWLQHQDQPVYAYGRGQIEQYGELARDRALRWAVE